jgi:hypothetical protein
VPRHGHKFRSGKWCWEGSAAWQISGMHAAKREAVPHCSIRWYALQGTVWRSWNIFNPSSWPSTFSLSLMREVSHVRNFCQLNLRKFSRILCYFWHKHPQGYHCEVRKNDLWYPPCLILRLIELSALLLRMRQQFMHLYAFPDLHGVVSFAIFFRRTIHFLHWHFRYFLYAPLQRNLKKDYGKCWSKRSSAGGHKWTWTSSRYGVPSSADVSATTEG